MRDITITLHAAERYLERFAGNLTLQAASARLRKLLSRARFLHMCAGKARLYALGDIRFVVDQGALVTVYRPTYQDAGQAEDFWCLA